MIFPECPSPGGAIDWAAIAGRYAEWWRPMEHTAQHPDWHQEGDVATHTRMVAESLVADEAWRAREAEDRAVLFAAALLHDAGKPATTREEDGRVTSRGHSRAGAILARRVLWELGVDVRLRERVAALVRFHMRPHYFVTGDDHLRDAITMSVVSRCADLVTLARADALGRIGPDPAESMAAIDVFEAACAEYGCLYRAFPFANAHSRFLYFRRPDRNPFHAAHDDRRCTVTVLSGLPAAGKTTWAEAHPEAGPAISPDALRRALVERDGRRAAGRAIPLAYERAREHLRAGESFVWDATSLSRDVRARILSLAADYDAGTRIVAIETEPAAIFARNTAHDDTVPAATIERMLERWEFPDLTEAHAVMIVRG